MSTIDIKGQRFGKLIIRERGISHDRKARWNCLCDCGKTVTVRGDALRSGKTKSCGCLQVDVQRARNTIHGECPRSGMTREYIAWRAMISRCTLVNGKEYEHYGGRGITVCDRWRHSYQNFLSDMGRCPKRMTLDRRNNDGNYEPGNCRWATYHEQALNKRPRNGKERHADII